MNFLGIDLSKVPTQSLNDWRVYIIPILYVANPFSFRSDSPSLSLRYDASRRCGRG